MVKIMKIKRTISILIILVAIVADGNAQDASGDTRFFVEGMIGLLHQGGKLESNGVSKNIPSTYGFSILPKVGYWLNDVLAVGPHMIIRTVNRKEMIPDQDNPVKEIEFKTKEFSWGFYVFSRYEWIRKGNFSLLIDASMGYEGGNAKETTGLITNKTKTIKMIGAVVEPILAYDMSDKFSLTASSIFFNLGASYRTEKYENTGEKVKTHYFGFHTQSTVFYPIDVRLGFIYKF